MSDLLSKRCIPCEGNVKPLDAAAAKDYLSQVKDWTLGQDAKSISKEFAFKDFDETMQFVNAVAELAETEGHHPDMHVYYDRARLELSTHAIAGLSENDFILAAKVDEIEKEL